MYAHGYRVVVLCIPARFLFIKVHVIAQQFRKIVLINCFLR